ncbi:MAG: zinc ribbon domain-containing protein [Actinobacteria bacterium]|nr:zinc ribbon domain-containing protein [Actinomycetota bacterium]
MALAIFGITNSGLNLAASLVLLMLIVLWLALIVYTFLDARRRISDPFLIACATIASFFPYIGTAVYAIVRPPEYLEDAHERELEIRAAELRVRQLRDQSCPNCEYPVEKNFLRCPNCERRLKDPCPTCGKPVDPRWALCPYCESTLGGERRRRPQRPPDERELRPEGDERRARRSERDSRDEAEREEGASEQKRPRRKKAAAAATAKSASKQSSASTTNRESARGASEAPSNRTEQRSPSREPDPNPRQA